MKLSSETLNVLKNFASINPNILLKKGKVLTTISPSKNVLAKANVQEDFPEEVGIYDLNNFLTVLTLGKDVPELEFDDKHVSVKSLGGRSNIKYRVSEKRHIVIPPDKGITLPSVDGSFTLTADDYDWVLRTANVLKSPHIAIEGDGSKLKVTTFDAKIDTAHVNSTQVGDTDKEFKAVFKTDNLKMIPGSYAVEVCSQGFAYFKNTKDSIEYWVAIEKEYSKF
jgi:hypothetical protein